MSIKLSVVIPSYNRWRTLRLTLESLREQTLKRELYEVIVSDSGSTDDTIPKLRELELTWSNLRLVVNPLNRGRSGARNTGILSARGDVILFLDADMISTRELLDGHLSFHLQRPNSALLGLEVRVQDERELEEARRDVNSFLRKHPERASVRLTGTHPIKKPWYFTLTGNLSVPKELLIRAGLFDLRFEGYGYEDIELGYRLHKLGVTLYHLKLITFHFHPYTVEDREKVGYLSGRNLAKFYLKHGELQIPLRLGINPVNYLAHRLLREFVKDKLREIDRHRITELKGFYALLEDINRQFSAIDGYNDEMSSLKREKH